MAQVAVPVEAGVPSPAEDFIEMGLDLNQELIRTPQHLLTFNVYSARGSDSLRKCGEFFEALKSRRRCYCGGRAPFEIESFGTSLEHHAILLTKDEDFAHRFHESSRMPMVVWLRVCFRLSSTSPQNAKLSQTVTFVPATNPA